MQISNDKTGFQSNIKFIDSAQFTQKVANLNKKRHKEGYPWTPETMKTGKNLYTTEIMDCIAGGVIDNGKVTMFHLCTRSQASAKRTHQKGFTIKNFEFLQTRDIPNFPKSMEEFNFWDSPARHRYYTHRGWNLGDEDKAHWSVRQQLLLNTIDKELFSTENVIAGFFSDVFQRDNYEKKQRESFAILLYYVHILGDHLEAGKKTTPMDKMNAVALIAPLTRPNYDTKIKGC